jgi:hypothetical protein
MEYGRFANPVNQTEILLDKMQICINYYQTLEKNRNLWRYWGFTIFGQHLYKRGGTPMLPIVKLPCFVETILPRFSLIFNKPQLRHFGENAYRLDTARKEFEFHK